MPSAFEKSVSQTPVAAINPSTTTISAIRQSRRPALDAARAANRVAPCRTTATNGTQCPVGADARNT